MSSIQSCPVVGGEQFDPVLHRHQALRPLPWLTHAQREGGTFFLESQGAWVVTKHADVRAILEDPRTFSSSRTNKFVDMPNGPLAEAYPDGHPGAQSMLMKDPPEHTRMRRIVNRAFSPKTYLSKEPSIRARIERLTSGLVEKGECDLVSDFSEPLAEETISELVGSLPPENLDVRAWGQDYWDLIAGARQIDPAQQQVMADRAAEMAAWLDSLIVQRRSDPQDDIISFLLAATEGDSPALNDNQVRSTILSSAFVAGLETTSTFVPQLIKHTIGSPEVRARLSEDRSLIRPAVEEALRLVSPARAVRRVATVDTVVGGQTIAAGDELLIYYLAANYDASEFNTPEELRFDRSAESNHLAFGKGTHFCLGAPLIRLEGQIILETMLDAGIEVECRPEQTWQWYIHPQRVRLLGLPARVSTAGSPA